MKTQWLLFIIKQTLAVIFLTAWSGACLAQNATTAPHINIEEQENSLKSIQDTIESHQKRLNTAQSQQKHLSNQLKKDDQTISSLMHQIKKSRQQSQKIQKQIKRIQKDINQLLKNKESQKKQLELYLNLAHQQTKTPVIANLLHGDRTQTERMILYYHYLSAARTEKMEALELTQENLRDQQSQLKSQQSSFQKLTQSQQKASRNLKQKKRQREQTLQKIAQHINNHKSQLEFLQVEEAQLKNIIETALKAQKTRTLYGLSKLKGRLPWPTRGQIKAKFGQKRSGHVHWKGLMLRADEGKVVQSIAAGQVIYADWIRGLGMLTIINHGDGYMSLYGHAQSLFKQVGDYVSAEEAIALVGTSGGLNIPHLYFEIRHKGKAVNPTPYLKRQR
jgi:septal ring factor EnvC (AmiA/AmiB activator)